MKTQNSIINGNSNISIFDVLNSRITIFSVSIPKWFLYFITLAILIFSVYYFSDKLNSTFGLDKAFTKNVKKINIVILPFKQIGADSQDIGQIIANRLIQIGINESLPIDIKYIAENTIEYGNIDNLKKKLEYHNADIIIWGQYKSKINNDSNIYLVNYIAAKGKLQPYPNNPNFESTNLLNFKEFSFDDIIKGKLTADVETIIYFFSVVFDLFDKKYQSVENKCSKVINNNNNKIADFWFLYGLAKLEKRDYKNALFNISKAILLDSTNHMYYNYKGALLCYEPIAYPLAIYNLNRSITLHSNNASAFYNKALCISRNYSSIYNYECPLEVALNCCNKVVELSPDFEPVYYLKALILSKMGSYNDALTILDSYNINPQQKKELLSSIIIAKTIIDSLTIKWTKILEVNPNNIEALKQRGKIYQVFKLYYKALTDFSKILDNQIKDNQAFYETAVCYDSLAKYDLAIKYYSNVYLNYLSENKPDSSKIISIKVLIELVQNRIYIRNRCTQDANEIYGLYDTLQKNTNYIYDNQFDKQ